MSDGLPSDLPAHPLAELFPMLGEAEIAELADDIVTFGQRVPIVLLDGQVLDGRNRLAACRFAEIEPVFAPYEGDDPLGFVLSHNLHRRHLTESQRAMVAARIVDWDVGLNQSTAGAANLPTRKAAERLSISERAVRAARRIHERGADELVAAIRDGRLSVHAGEALSDLARDAQLEVLRQEEKAIIARAKAIREERQKTRHAVRLAHMDMVAEKGQASAGVVTKLFPVIYADPPWRFGVRAEETGREKSAENHYPTIPTDELCGLLAAIGGVASRDCVLFLWATNPMLLDGLRVMQAWGFTYKSHWIWDKEVAGTGYWGRDRHELLLIGTRGDAAAPLPGTQPESVFRERKGPHSAKPDFFADTIERLYPGIGKIELFARRARPGWDVWGFEVDPPIEPVARSSTSNAGELPEAAGPPPGTPGDAHNAPLGPSGPRKRGEISAALPADLRPSDHATEITIGGMRKNGEGSLSFRRAPDDAYVWSYRLNLAHVKGSSGPFHDPHDDLESCVAAALAFARTTLADWAERSDSVLTDGHRAAARGGAKWCGDRMAAWGLAEPAPKKRGRRGGKVPA